VSFIPGVTKFFLGITLSEINPPHWMSGKARCQIHVIQATRSFIKCMASLQYTVSPKPPRQSKCKCSWWPHLETKSNVWSPSSIFVILVSVIMYIALYIAYSESQDFKHRCQVIDVNKYIFYPKKSEFSLRAGCVLSLFFLCIELIEMVFFMIFLTE